IEDVVLTGHVENVLCPAAFQDFVEGIEFLRLRELGNISRVDEERWWRWHRVDAIERNFEGLGNILVRVFAKTDVAVADLQEAEISSRQRFCGLCYLGEGFRHEDAATDRPK